MLNWSSLSLQNHLKVTYADFALDLLCGLIQSMEGLKPTMEKFPKICALQQAVENLPNIKAWVEKRPKTQY